MTTSKISTQAQAIDANLPILDFSLYEKGGKDREQFIKDLLYSAHEIGFFYIKNHGVSLELLEEAEALSKAFFAQSLEDKLQVSAINSPHFRGYTAVHGEITRKKPDSREQFDTMLEYPAIPLAEIPLEKPWLRIYGPNQWPESLPRIKTVFEQLQKAQTALAISLLKAFALALGQKEDAFANIYQDKPSVVLRAIHYPGIENSEQGVGAHKDFGVLTFVRQGKVAGLEVLKDDEWVLATPIPGTFVVNIGELLEAATNGFLKATLHRVVPTKVGESRYSIAYFLNSDLDSEVPQLTLPSELQAAVTGITQDPDNPIYANVGKNLLKGRLRSHPDVAERFYADINIETL
ncbi:isopenicillin N synthase family oxygenase [Ignatzschineria rhizosphaerae]|uniref:2-oxoglutarate-dependent ethylene/succinate-forming enzyme n=1 Tax=Ignatzschineria rhizosphaerae TaxID=2923279 RepID=A0ABY3WYN7_9GAMM|nr:2-oxoglutarate and iron-dependent oxygenase domain-containing protein [Ignatzschineria rhizosphaerae]UNM95726.1 isopenicillin N synthase family oxygenase [Ignatzschineria rhizosphaerae]